MNEHLPCGDIGKINSKVDEIIKALQIVAEQKVEIKHLVETQRDHREWLLSHQREIQLLKQWKSALSGAQQLLLMIPVVLSVVNVVFIWLSWGKK